MSKTQTQMVKGGAGDNLPAFMRDKEVVGLDTLKDYIILPRLKVIQKSADGALRDQFSVGDVVLVPQNILVAGVERDNKGNSSKAGAPFLVVPVFFFPSWGTINDMRLKGKAPMFLKQTVDPMDPLVALCKNPATWEQPHPTEPNMKVRNCEMLNFVIVIQHPDLEAQPIVAQFSKSEWMSGSNWASLIKLTRRSLFARKWELTSTYRPGSGKGDWYGINVKQPTDPANVWVGDEEQYHGFEKLNADLAESHRAKRISVDVSDEVDAAGAGAPSTDAPKDTPY